MQKLFEIFKGLQFQKRMIAAATICGNTVCYVRGKNFRKKNKCAKMFKFLNQCFARLRFWKSVSDSRNLLDGATAVLLKTLFQN